MAILKTTYGSTGSVSYEQIDSLLVIGGANHVIRIYAGDSVQEREMTKDDRVEVIEAPVRVFSEGCADVGCDSKWCATQIDIMSEMDSTITESEEEKPKTYNQLVLELNNLYAEMSNQKSWADVGIISNIINDKRVEIEKALSKQ